MKKILFIVSFCCSQLIMAVNIQQFSRSNTLTYEMLEDARLVNNHVFNDYDLVFTLGASYVESPLTVKSINNTVQLGTVIDDMIGIHFGLGVNLSREFMLGLSGTYSMFKDQQGTQKQDFSDFELSAKWRFLEGERWGLAIMPLITIPTKGGDIIFNTINNGPQPTTVLSDETFGFGAKLVYEYYFKYLNLVTNLGYKYAKGAYFDDIDLVHRLYTGIGAYIPVSRSTGLNVEWLRQWSLPLNNKNQNPNEVFLGFSSAITEHFAFFGGVGLGNQNLDVDGNDYRLTAGLKYAPRIWSRKQTPIELVEEVKAIVKTCKTPLVEMKKAYVLRFPNDVGDVWSDEGLKLVADALKKNEEFIESIEINGHTSAPASKSYNQYLSEKRAKVVQDYFYKNNIKSFHMMAQGFGETQLLDESVGEEADYVNRRTEILVRYKKDLNLCGGVQ